LFFENPQPVIRSGYFSIDHKFKIGRPIQIQDTIALFDLVFGSDYARMIRITDERFYENIVLNSDSIYSGILITTHKEEEKQYQMTDIQVAHVMILS
jgi:hypothetical protein